MPNKELNIIFESLLLEGAEIYKAEEYKKKSYNNCVFIKDRDEHFIIQKKDNQQKKAE